MEFTFKFSEQHAQIIMNALVKEPFQQVAEVITSVQSQVQSQLQAEQAKQQGKKPSKQNG